MAYIKRTKYTVINDADLKKDLIETLKEKGLPSAKVRQLVYYPIPMSLIRWARWLEPEEIDIYLEPYDDSNDEDSQDMGF